MCHSSATAAFIKILKSGGTENKEKERLPARQKTDGREMYAVTMLRPVRELPFLNSIAP